MKSPRESLEALLDLVLATKPVEINCEEFFDQIAAYVDAGGQDLCDNLSEAFGKVRQHLSVCPECLEVFDALRQACECD